MRTCALAVTGWLLMAGAALAQAVEIAAPVMTLTGQTGGISVQSGDVVFSSFGQPARDAQPPATGTSIIRGRVIDATSASALRRALVTLSSAEARISRSRSTDADGRYAFDNLPAGRYNIVVNKVGYVTWQYGQRRPLEGGQPVVLADKQALDRVDLALPRGGIITGRVLDEYGDPVADVQVMPMRNQFTPTGRRPMASGRGAQTNDIGEFRLFGLSPGDYVISTTVRAMPMMSSVDDDRSGYAPTYYPGTANVLEAQSIRVGAGETVTGLTLMLVPTRTATVSGVAIDSQGRVVRNGFVNALQRNGGPPMSAAGGQIRPDGTFTISGLAPGNYTLTAMLPGQMMQANRAPEMMTAMVAVNGDDVTGVRLEPRAAVTISGRITLDPPGAPGLKPQMLRFAPASVREPDPMATPPQIPEAVREDWTFSLKSYPGLFAIRPLGLPQGWMIRSMRWRGTDVMEGLDIRNENLEDVEIEITNRVPDLSGRVINGRGDAVPEYTAIVFSQDRELWTSPGALSRSAVGRPDEQGRFRIRSLRPGAYYITAVVQVENGQWLDPEFLELLRPGAIRITIAEGEAKTVELKIAER